MIKKLTETLRVSIVGEPNVGKSTLINSIFKKKVSIVTRKSQTTLKKKAEILFLKNKQIIFLDTPGIFSEKAVLSRSTFKQASNAILESNLVLVLVSGVKPNIHKTKEILKYINSLDKEYLIIINKIDLLKKNIYLKALENIQLKLQTRNLLTVSSLKSTGINHLLNFIVNNFKFFKKEKINYKKEIICPELVEEVVREKVLNNIHDEIPYNLKFKTENIEKKNNGSFRVDLSIILNKSTYKPIILGKSGSSIKKISISAREDLERMLKVKIHLFLFLKLTKKSQEKVANLEK